jgi:alpha-ketoglutarate-dependent taurine dioxygenase
VFIRIAGTIFDVVSTDNPINIAYSNIALDLHQDLPYYESPPGVQLLHCLKFSPAVTGAIPPAAPTNLHSQTFIHKRSFTNLHSQTFIHKQCRGVTLQQAGTLS